MSYVKPGLYKHYKGGLYIVVATVPDKTEGREGSMNVIYYSEGMSQWYTRDVDDFTSSINDDRGMKIPKFSRVKDRNDALDQ